MRPLPAGNRGSNLLVGGLFLHQRRRAAPSVQQAATDCSGRFSSLEFRCQYASALQVGQGECACFLCRWVSVLHTAVACLFLTCDRRAPCRCCPLTLPQAAAARGLNTSHLAPAAGSGGEQGAEGLPPAWGVDPAVLESSPLYYAPLAYSMGAHRCIAPFAAALLFGKANCMTVYATV